MVHLIAALLSLLALPLVTLAADPYEAFSVLRIEKKPAPEFSLPAVNGRQVKLLDDRGKVILLGFFKTF